MITIQDIANRSGVSISTVSRALDNSTRISLETRKRIQSLAQEMGYTPNFAARNLMADESNTVGVVFQPQNPEISGNDFVLHELFGINNQLCKMNYLLAAATGNSWGEVFESVKMMVEAGKVRRFILLYTTGHDPITQLLKEFNARVVVIGEPQSKLQTLFVDNDNQQASREATQLLTDKFNLSHPIFIRTEADWFFEINREAGFKQVWPDGEVIKLSQSFVDQKSQLKEFFETHPNVDGIIATDDKIGILAQLQAENVLDNHQKLPTVAFNASEYGQLSKGNFYSVDVQPNILGSESVRLLFNDKDKKDNLKQIMVPYRLPSIP
jgi:DNA-binding LacI/PurR family transcriptional regulator